MDPLQRGNGGELKLESVLSSTSTRTKLSPDEVQPDADGLTKLIATGSWRSLLKVADRCIESTKYPHYILQVKLCKVIAQMKMRMYKAALDEIEGIGNFDGSTNVFESYKELYPNMKGSMVPFELRLIKAELPYFLKTNNSLDPLYELLAYCRQRIAKLKLAEDKRDTATSTSSAAAASPTASPNEIDAALASSALTSSILLQSTIEASSTNSTLTAQEESVSVWLQREKRVMLCIATRLLQEKEYPLALSLLLDLLNKHPNDTALLSSLGRVHLQVLLLSLSVTM
jgi:hypothetical protein